MFDINTKYQAGVFVNIANVLPTPDVIAKLLSIFSDKGFLPSTFQEISTEAPRPLTRLQLASPDGEWIISFASHRVDIEKNPTDPYGGNLGNIEEFVTDACDFFTRIMEHFNKKGNRLTLITSGLLPSMSEASLQEMYTKVIRPLPFYTRSIPFEWNSKTSAGIDVTINDSTETLNVLTAINRVHGQVIHTDGIMTLDRIEVSFDINTSRVNDENRFTPNKLREFFDKALNIRNILSEEILGLYHD